MRYLLRYTNLHTYATPYQNIIYCYYHYAAFTLVRPTGGCAPRKVGGRAPRWVVMFEVEILNSGHQIKLETRDRRKL